MDVLLQEKMYAVQLIGKGGSDKVFCTDEVEPQKKKNYDVFVQVQTVRVNNLLKIYLFQKQSIS